MRGGFSRYISPGPRDPRRDQWNSEVSQILSHERFIFIFSFFGGYFQLFLVYLEKQLCKIHLDFWIMVVYHHSHLQWRPSFHHKWFYWPSNSQFWEKFQPVPGAPKQSCSALQNFSWRPCPASHIYLYYEKKVDTAMINNSTKFHNANLSTKIIVHKKKTKT